MTTTQSAPQTTPQTGAPAGPGQAGSTGGTLITQNAIEQFLYREARYLDDREFDKWLECYAPDAEFWMPAWDDDDTLAPNLCVDGGAKRDLHIGRGKMKLSRLGAQLNTAEDEHGRPR